METIAEFLEKNPHLADFYPYLEELNKESDRGKVLISTGFMEEQLRLVLASYLMTSAAAEELLNGANAPLGSFSARIAACFSLGLISDDEHHDLSVIRKIRNDFAHRIKTSFKTQSVIDRCSTLRLKAHDTPDHPVPPVGQFTTAAVSVILRLVNRPHYVSLERRTYRNWRN